MKALAIVGVVVGVALSVPAGAQELPSIPRSFELDSGEPSPCFVFACFNHSAFDGDTLVAVGANLPNVYVWVRDSSGAWSQQAVLTRPDPNAPSFDQEFGSLLAIDGDDVVVSGGALGGLLVYQRRGTTWSYRQTLPGSGYLDLENGTLVTTDASGFAVYEKGAGGLFRKRATLKLPRFVDGYLSGPVELDRNTAVIAGGDDADGAVFVFQRLFGVWLFAQKLAAPPAAAGGGFGTAIAIDHDRIAVGAPGVLGSDAIRPGVVQTSVRRGLQWRAFELLTNPISTERDGYERPFGVTVDLEDRRLVAGAGNPSYPYAPFVPANYVYELTGGSWALSAALEASAAQALQLSGDSVLVDTILLRYGTLPTIFDLP
jgi:hypothetical protein